MAKQTPSRVAFLKPSMTTKSPIWSSKLREMQHYEAQTKSIRLKNVKEPKIVQPDVEKIRAEIREEFGKKIVAQHASLN